MVNVDTTNVNPSSTGAENPYAPAMPVEDRGAAALRTVDLFEGRVRPSIGWIICRWAAVCGISAAPSFLIAIGVGPHRAAPMILGVLCFVFAYVCVDAMTYHKPWRAIPKVRGLMIFCYATRIVVTVIYPLGLGIDMLTGMVSYSIVSLVAGPISARGTEPIETSMGVTFALTIVQGCLLNLLLAAWGVIGFFFVCLFNLFLRMIAPESSRPVKTDTPAAG